MKIALLDDPYFLDCQYRGVNRKNGAYIYFDKSNKDRIISLWNWYMDEDAKGSIEYNESSTKTILELFSLSKKAGYKGEIIIYGYENEILHDVHFLGFDVCSEESYYSMLGDGLSCKKPVNELIITKVIWSYFNTKLNVNGLFDNVENAKELSGLMNELLLNWPNYIERIDNPKPIRIYSLTN